MKIISFLLGLCALYGCGTITTLSVIASEVSSKLRSIDSDCGTVPRIYSVVVYDHCSIRSDQTSRWLLIWFVPVGFYAIDMLVPYTVQTQREYASLQIQ